MAALKNVKARDLMKREVLTLNSTAPIKEAIEVFEQYLDEIGRVPLLTPEDAPRVLPLEPPGRRTRGGPLGRRGVLRQG